MLYRACNSEVDVCSIDRLTSPSIVKTLETFCKYFSNFKNPSPNKNIHQKYTRILIIHLKFHFYVNRQKKKKKWKAISEQSGKHGIDIWKLLNETNYVKENTFIGLMFRFHFFFFFCLSRTYERIQTKLFFSSFQSV